LFLNKVSRIGIALTGLKTNKESYLYSQEVAFYDKRGMEKAEIVMLNKESLSIGNFVSRLGGKGRVVHVEVRDIDLEEKRVEKERYAVLISDAIIDIRNISISDIREYYELTDKINNISENYGFKIIHGEIEYRSLGWDLYSDRPKPFYFFLKAGSLIKINYKKQNEKENK